MIKKRDPKLKLDVLQEEVVLSLYGQVTQQELGRYFKIHQVNICRVYKRRKPQ